MDIKQTDLYWFQLNEEIRVEDVDKFSGNNMHPDRMMTQWVLVLMISGERSFRVYGENYVVHSGEFFLLPPYVQHCGLQYDNHAAYFAHFQATGIQIPPPVKVDRQKKNMVLSEDSTNGRLFCSLLFAIVRMNLTLTERFIT
jgi:hypothetical protein